MAIISEVQCGRCDRRYSSMRGRCPYCGARRGSSGKHATETNNMKGKVIIAALIAVVLIVAVVVLLLANGKDGTESPVSPPPTGLPGEGEVIAVTSSPLPSTEPEPSEEPTATPPPAVTSVDIRYLGSVTVDFMEPVGTTIPLTCVPVPAETDEIPVWESSDEGVFQVVAADTTGRGANVTITGSGSAKLTVTVGNVSHTIDVRGK